MSLYNRLMDPTKTSPLGLKGAAGPTFENISQRYTSDIQALAPVGALLSSQDLLTGRTYAVGYKPAFAPPSNLDLNGQTPFSVAGELPYVINGPKF